MIVKIGRGEAMVGFERRNQNFKVKVSGTQGKSTNTWVNGALCKFKFSSSAKSSSQNICEISCKCNCKNISIVSAQRGTLICSLRWVLMGTFPIYQNCCYLMAAKQLQYPLAKRCGPKTLTLFLLPQMFRFQISSVCSQFSDVSCGWTGG